MNEGERNARWLRVRELVERAFELDARERDAFLAGEPDRAIAEEARALLALEATPDPFAGDPPALASIAPPPERVGPYELRRELGAGGMGRVWLGARADGAFHGLVAIKRIQLGLDDAAARERFVRERQVLANLRHPGIARLLDGGVDEGGSPYLVMEYVEGLAIDRFCDAHRLELRERAALFRKVCDAVHHAHQSLVVHRDLKPQNVLVTPEGEPKLCDFGIAKVLDPEKSSASPELTGPLQRFLTPSYASPEQVRGLPITTASDVYSLGALLYLLLVGRPPHALPGRSAAQVEVAVCEEEPERPSLGAARAPDELAAVRGTTPRRWRRALSGDLERIVLQALRKEPQRRYASAEQLGADLERWLQGRPVLARPDTALYRSARFLARHRGAVAAAALALALLLAGLFTSLAEYRRAEAAASELARERDGARERSRELERTSASLAEQKALAEARLASLTDLALRLVFDVHREVYALEGATRATELVLRTGLEKLEALDAEARGDPELLRQLSGGYLRLGEVQGDPEAANLGRADDAWASYERALELARKAHALQSDAPGSAFVLASALLKHGLARDRRGEREAAIEELREGTRVCEGVPDAERASSEGLLYIAHTLHASTAGLLLQGGDWASAETELAGSAAWLERLGRTRSVAPAVLADERARLAILRIRCLDAGGRVDAAVDACWEARDELERALADDPANRALRRARCSLRGATASILERDGDVESALALREENGSELAELAAGDPRDRRAAFDLAVHHRELAALHRRRGDHEAARASEARREAHARRMLATSPDDPVLMHERASALVGVGEADLELGRLLDGSENAREARRLFEALVARDPESAPARLGRVAALRLIARTHRELAERSAPGDERDAELARARARLEEARDELDELDRLALAVPDLDERRERVEGELAEIGAGRD